MTRNICFVTIFLYHIHIRKMIDMSYISYIHIAEIEEIKTTGEWYFIVNKISIQPYGVLMLWSQCPIGWICVMQWQCHQWLIVVYLMENSLSTLRVPCCTISTIARWLESMYTHLRLSVSLPVSVSLYQIAYLCNYAPGKYIKQYSFLQPPYFKWSCWEWVTCPR